MPERHGQRRVPLDAINWIEAAKDYVLLHTPTRSHMVRTTMGALEERLNGSRLMRVHRSATRAAGPRGRGAPRGGNVILVLEDGAQVQVGPITSSGWSRCWGFKGVLGGVASTRNRAKSPSGSVHSSITVQPPARSSRRASRGPYLWLFSVWIVSPSAMAKSLAATVVAEGARRLQMHLDPGFGLVPEGPVAEMLDRDGAAELAVDAVEQVEVEGGRHAGGIVIGGDEDVLSLDPVDADQQHRARAAEVVGHGAQQVRRAVGGTMLPIVEPGKKPSFGSRRTGAGSVIGCMKSRLDRRDREGGEALGRKGLGRGAQEIAGNVDRDIGGPGPEPWAFSRCGVLADEPEPNSITGPARRRSARANSRPRGARMPVSVRVG